MGFLFLIIGTGEELRSCMSTNAMILNYIKFTLITLTFWGNYFPIIFR